MQKRLSIKNNSGMTLLEILLALSILSIGLLSLVFLTEINRVGYKALSSDVRLGELVLDNVNEIKGLKRNNLPAEDKCIVKYFDVNGKFTSESAEMNITSGECTGQTVVSKGFQVAWKVQGPSSINAEFNPSATLKLPKYYDSVIRVEIIGWTPDLSKKGHNTQIEAEVYIR